MVSSKRNVLPPITMALAVISLGISLWASYVLQIEIGQQEQPIQIKTTWKGTYYKENGETTRMNFENFDTKKLLCGVYDIFKKQQMKFIADHREVKVKEYRKAFDTKMKEKIRERHGSRSEMERVWDIFFQTYKFNNLEQTNLNETFDDGLDCEKEAKDLGGEDANKYAKYLHFVWVALICIFALLLLTFSVNSLEFATRPIRNCGWRCSVNGFVIFFTILLFALGIVFMIGAPMVNKQTSEAMTDVVTTTKKSLNTNLKREISNAIRSSMRLGLYANSLAAYSNDAIRETSIEFFGEYVFTVKSESSPLFLVVTASLLIIFIAAFCSMKFEEEEYFISYADDVANPGTSIQVNCHDIKTETNQSEITQLEVDGEAETENC